MYYLLANQILWKAGFFFRKTNRFSARFEVPHVCKTEKFVTVFTRSRQLSLSCASSIHFKLCQVIPWKSILILSFYSLLGFPRKFTHKYLCDLWKILEVLFYAVEWIIKFQISFIESSKWISFLNTDNNLNYVENLSSYCAVNTSSIDYERKSVLANNCCLLCGTYNTH